MEKILVSIRVRPPNRQESSSSTPWRIDANTISLCSSIGVQLTGQSFVFDNVFGPEVDTFDVYGTHTKDIICSAVNGFNGTVFAYGQTSSGKTFTIRGSPDQPGIIPLAVYDVFETIQQTTNREFLLRVSYMEIYNEEINDLLAPENRKLQVHESVEKSIFVAGLREEIVVNPEQVLALMQAGEENRHVGETNMNTYSSRSHTIFRMVIESREKGRDYDSSIPAEGGTDAVRVSTLNLVDLAGSERVAKTGAEGVRLKEGTHINKSLMTLGTVINKLSDGAEKLGGHVPYRDSKLTRILQPALGGNAKTAIICCITPALIHVDETKGTLQFASRAKRVTNCARVNEILTDAALLKRQQKEIEELRSKLQETHSPHLEEEILNLRNALLKFESERERMVMELQEEKAAQAERERRIKEQEKKIANLSTMVINSAVDDRNLRPRKENRRETWCPPRVLSIDIPKKESQRLIDRGFPVPQEIPPAPNVYGRTQLLSPAVEEAPEEAEPVGECVSTPKAGKSPVKKFMSGHPESPGKPARHSPAGARKCAAASNCSPRPIRSPGQVAKKRAIEDQCRSPRQPSRSSHSGSASLISSRKPELATLKEEPANQQDGVGAEFEHYVSDRRAKSLGNSSTIIEELRAQVRSLELEKSFMQRELDELAEEMNGQTSKELEMVELQQTLEDTKNALHEVEKKHAGSIAKIEEQGQTIKNLDSSLNEKNRQNENLEARLHELDEERAVKDDQLEAMKMQLAALAEQLKEASVTRANITSSTGLLQDLVLESREEGLKDCSKCSAVQSEKHDLAEQIKQHQDDQCDLLHQTDGQKERIKQLEKLLEAALQSNQNLQEQMASSGIRTVDTADAHVDPDEEPAILCAQAQMEATAGKYLGLLENLNDVQNRVSTNKQEMELHEQQSLEMETKIVQLESERGELVGTVQELATKLADTMGALAAAGVQCSFPASSAAGSSRDPPPSPGKPRDELLQEMEQLSRRVHELDLELTQRDDKMQNKDEELQRLTEDVTAAEGRITESNSKIEALSEELKALREQEKSEQASRKVLCQEVERLNQELMASSVEVERLLKSASAEQGHHKTAIEEHGTEIERLKGCLVSLEGKLAATTAELHETALQKAQLQDRCDNLVEAQGYTEAVLVQTKSEAERFRGEVYDLEDRLIKLEDEKSKAEHARAETLQQVDLLHSQQVQLTDDLAQLRSIAQEDTAKLREAITDKEDRCNKLQQQLDRLTKEKQMLEEALASAETAASAQGEDYMKLLTEKDAHCADVTQELIALETQKVAADKKIEDLETQLSAEKASAAEAMHKLESCRQQHHHDTAQLRTELASLRKDVVAAKARPAALEKERDACLKDMEKCRTKLKDTEAKLKNVLQEKSAIQAEKANMERELRKLRGQSTQLTREVTRRESLAERRRESIAHGLTKAKHHATSIEQQLHNKSTELERSQHELQMLQEAHEHLEVAHASLQASKVALEQKLEEIGVQLETGMAGKETVSGQYQQLQAELEGAKSELESAENELATLRRNHDELLAELRASQQAHEEASMRVEQLPSILGELAQLTGAQLHFDEEKATWLEKERAVRQELEQAEKELAAAETTIARQEQDLQLQEEKIAQLCTQLETEKATKEQLNQKLLQLDNAVALEKERLASVKDQEVLALEARVELLSDQLEDVQAQLAAAEEAARASEKISSEKLTSLQKTKVQLNEMLQQSMSQLVKAQKAEKLLSVENQALLTSSTKLEVALDAAHGRLEVFQSRLAEADAENASLRVVAETVDPAAFSSEPFSSSNKGAARHIASLSTQIEALQAQLQRSQEDLQHAQAALANGDGSQEANLQQQCEEYRKQIEQLMEESRTSSNLEREGQVIELQEANRLLKVRLRKLEGQIERAKAWRDESRRLRDAEKDDTATDLTARLKALQDEKEMHRLAFSEELQKVTRELDAQAVDSRLRQEKLEAQVSALEKSLVKMTAEKTHLQNELQDLASRNGFLMRSQALHQLQQSPSPALKVAPASPSKNHNRKPAVPITPRQTVGSSFTPMVDQGFCKSDVPSSHALSQSELPPLANNSASGTKQHLLKPLATLGNSHGHPMKRKSTFSDKENSETWVA